MKLPDQVFLCRNTRCNVYCFGVPNPRLTGLCPMCKLVSVSRTTREMWLAASIASLSLQGGGLGARVVEGHTLADAGPV